MRRFSDAKTSLQSINMDIRVSSAPSEPREYRVCLPELRGQAQEDSAYYTDDLDDAVITGSAMRRTATRNK